MKLLTWLVLCSIGYFISDIILKHHTSETIPALLKFIPLVGIPVCAPIWKLYDNLRKLRDNDELTKVEFREVAYKIEINSKKMLFNMFYLLLGSSSITLAMLTTEYDQNNLNIIYKCFSIFSLTSVGILANTIYNIKEIESFENMLAKRKNNKRVSKNLLEEMKKKK